MKCMLILEMKKALKNKYFFLSIFIGCGITLLSLYYNVDKYLRDMSVMNLIEERSGVAGNPLTAMFTLFNKWISGEAFSLGSSIFFFVFPLLVSIPYGWSYCEEKVNGYTRSVVVKSGKKEYFLSKYIAVFLSGGLAMVIPLLFSLLTTALFFPAILPQVIYDISYGVFGTSLMSYLYYTIPFLYVFIYLCIDFVFCGLIACISFGVTSFIKYRIIVVILPFFLLLGFHYFCQFIYSLDFIKHEISPLNFLRGMPIRIDASWLIILIEAAVLFLFTFLLSMVWERRREIY